LCVQKRRPVTIQSEELFRGRAVLPLARMPLEKGGKTGNCMTDQLFIMSREKKLKNSLDASTRWMGWRDRFLVVADDAFGNSSEFDVIAGLVTDRLEWQLGRRLRMRSS